jgi:hypothetical protein
VASCPNVASTVGSGDAQASVGWLGRSLWGGVELGGQQNGAQRLGLGGGMGGRSRREEEGFWQGGLGLPFFP